MIRNLVGAKELRRQLRTHPRHLQQGGPRWPEVAQPAHGCHCNAEQGGFCHGSWDLWVLPVTCVLEVYLSTSAGTFKHLICTFSTSFLCNAMDSMVWVNLGHHCKVRCMWKRPGEEGTCGGRSSEPGTCRLLPSVSATCWSSPRPPWATCGLSPRLLSVT